MNKGTEIIIGVVALVVIVGGSYASMSNKDDAMIAKEKMEQRVMEEKEVMTEDDATKTDNMMKKGEVSATGESEVMMKTDEGVVDHESMVKSGAYEAYSADKISRAETGDVVLFFHASWCPSCRGLNTSIENNLKSIPEGVSILKTDYDKETELKKKYGVTYQHTLVQVDKDGNMIKKWSGSPSLDSVLSQIQ